MKNAWRLKVVDARGWPPDSHENISIRGCVMFLDRFFSLNGCPVGEEVRIPMVGKSMGYLGGGNSNIHYFHPENGGDDPI